MIKERITYNQIYYYTKQLINQLKNIKFDYIYGIPRGGLPIAVQISHYLNIPLIFELTKLDDNKYYLIVDDIIDTGKTVLNLLKEIKNCNYITCSLFFKPKRSIFRPDLYIIETDNWIEFPWEPENDVVSNYHKKLYF